jgi:ABC-type glycerol-3-phosphate transport system permease component
MIAAVMILPIYWLFVSSIRPAGSIFKYTRELSWGTFIPSQLSLENYQFIFSPERSNYAQALRSTLFVAGTTALLGVIVNSAAGFAFAVFRFKGKTVLFALVLLTVMMPFESIVVPLYVLIRALGLFDTYQALILPGIANGLVIFLFRQFLASIPGEIFDAARVDGSSWWDIYWRIVMPLSWPVAVTALLMIFIQLWEAFFWPLVAAPSPDHVLVQVEIVRNITFDEAVWGRLFSSSTVATLLPMCLFLALQKYYVRSMMSSAFK